MLMNFVQSRRLGVVQAGDTGFILARSPDTVRGPDVAFVTRERFEAVGRTAPPFPGAPDLAVEVLAPSDRPGAVQAKVGEYLAAGTRIVWIVDPASERVNMFHTLLASRTLTRDQKLDGEDVLPGFRVTVAEIFEI